MKKLMILLAVTLVTLVSCQKEVIEPTVETVVVYETIIESSEAQLQSSMVGEWYLQGVEIESGFVPINSSALVTNDNINWYGTSLNYTIVSCDMIELDGQLKTVTFSVDTMFITSADALQHSSYIFIL